MSARAATALAWSLWALSVAFAVLGLLFVYLNGSFANLLDESEGIDLVSAVAFPTVGAVIASRRPGNAVGWLFCVIGLLQGMTVFGGEYGYYALVTEPGLPAGVISTWFGTWAWLPSLVLMGTFLLLLFPDGRLPSRRWRPVAWTAGGLAVASAAILATAPWDLLEVGVPAGNPFEIGAAWAVFEAAAIPMLLVGVATAFLSVLSVVLRFGRSVGEERQQLKWFVYAGVLTVTVLLFPPITPAFADAITFLQITTTPLLPVAAGIAIFRHRLYDIDVIVNRTLVYGALTATLILIYLGSVVGLQYAFRALTVGTGSKPAPTLAVVASTLFIAALFNPLRRRLQDFIDRLFYRNKYDARETLEAFGARLRDKTDLDALDEDLLSVVRDTVRPVHVTLWLREPGERR